MKPSLHLINVKETIKHFNNVILYSMSVTLTTTQMNVSRLNMSQTILVKKKIGQLTAFSQFCHTGLQVIYWPGCLLSVREANKQALTMQGSW